MSSATPIRPPSTIRCLREGEQSEFLGLLAGWPFADQRRGDEFFARTIDQDPSFQLDNVWVAEQHGILVAACQIFPRPIRIARESVPAGGVGTVFTREQHRRCGLGRGVIAAAVAEMQRRGFELAMLWTNRWNWYEQQGFGRWGKTIRSWQLDSGLAQPRLLGPSLAIEQFDRDRHLTDVMALAERYSGDRHGTVARGEQEWSASLALAGNPVEEFVVAMDDRLDQVIAFLRGCMLDGSWQVLEWACAEGHESYLAELIAATVRTVGQKSLVAPTIGDTLLERALQERGLKERPMPAEAPEWMLRCLAPKALAGRFGLRYQSETENPASSVLSTVLPPPAFHFWTADRF